MIKYRNIKFEIQNFEAIVLLEAISKINAKLEDNFFDRYEKSALFHLESLLEKNIDEVFNENYNEILEFAKTQFLKN